MQVVGYQEFSYSLGRGEILKSFFIFLFFFIFFLTNQFTDTGDQSATVPVQLVTASLGKVLYEGRQAHHTLTPYNASSKI